MKNLFEPDTINLSEFSVPTEVEQWGWYISVSFSRSSSSNFSRAIYLAKNADYFLQTDFSGQDIFQAFYRSNPTSYLNFIQLYELISNWKSTFVMINGQLVDRKLVSGLNYCYGDRCRSGRSDFCFGASMFTKNPFGCHRLQISAFNNPWWSFSHLQNNMYYIHKNESANHIREYKTLYTLCPSYPGDDYINKVINDLPDKLTQEQFYNLSQQNSLTDTYQQPYDQQPQPNITINQLEYKQGLSISPKSKIITLILVIFLGFLGIHRFYAGKVGTGIIWFLTAGFFVFGWIYDIIKIASGTFTDGMGFTIRK